MNNWSHQTFVKLYAKPMFDAWFLSFVDFCLKKFTLLILKNEVDFKVSSRINSSLFLVGKGEAAKFNLGFSFKLHIWSMSVFFSWHVAINVHFAKCKNWILPPISFFKKRGGKIVVIRSKNLVEATASNLSSLSNLSHLNIFFLHHYCIHFDAFCQIFLSVNN